MKTLINAFHFVSQNKELLAAAPGLAYGAAKHRFIATASARHSRRSASLGGSPSSASSLPCWSVTA